LSILSVNAQVQRQKPPAVPGLLLADVTGDQLFTASRVIVFWRPRECPAATVAVPRSSSGHREPIKLGQTS
jgi:hypothetical protein